MTISDDDARAPSSAILDAHERANMNETGKVWDGRREWTYADLAENASHLRYLIEDHSPDTNSGKTYCPTCDHPAPCDITTLAATGLAALESADRLREALAWYADRGNYDASGAPCVHIFRGVIYDNGERARAALSAAPGPAREDGREG